ncbi:MAG: hypothetical protein K6U11_07810 [bacterium]|nr:hypothetical protein [bacterium]
MIRLINFYFSSAAKINDFVGCLRVGRERLAGAPTRSPGLLLPPVWVKTEASRGAPKRAASVWVETDPGGACFDVAWLCCPFWVEKSQGG